VDGAIFVSPFTLYRFDASYAQEVYAKHADRFALVKPVDPNDPAVEEVIADWAATPGAVGIRLMMNEIPGEDPADPNLNRVLAAAARHSMVANILTWGRFDQSIGLIKRNPDTLMVIDHLGIFQPVVPPVPEAPWADLPRALEMAQFDNVRMKISGACVLSKEPYPYEDIWEPVLKIVDAYGVDRCMWGTDWTRAVKFLTYPQGVDAFRDNPRFSDGDKAALLGRTAEKVYGWSPKRG
jgi:L-fuconolactonase